MRLVAVTAAVLLAACAAMRAQKHQEVRADASEFKNLQVLPSNISHDELIATMRGYAAALGTRCDHCHVAMVPGASGVHYCPSCYRVERAAQIAP